MANRYISGSRLSDDRIEALLWCVCSLQTVSQAASQAGISERSAGEVMRRLRARISRQKTLFEAVDLQSSWPGEASDYWKTLFDCVYACPSEIRSNMPSDRLGRGVFLQGKRELCRICQHSLIATQWPLLLRTLHYLQNAQRGVSVEGFRDLFLTVLLYDRYRSLEIENATKDPEAMKRLGSTRSNHMTMLYEACRDALRR